MKTISLLIIVSVIASPQFLSAQDPQPDRVIVLTDIEADPDDTQSLIRLLLYSNEIDIKGLVATTSVWQKTRVAPESIRKIIHAYGEVHSNLIAHDDRYPDAEALISLVRQGPAKYGMLGVGDGRDTEGSDWIIKVLDDDDRPLWISVWGGVNTLAQALHKIRSTRTEEEAEALISKLRVYTISDQDDSGIWIRNEFSDLFYVVSPGDHYGSATWTAINTLVEGIDNSEISNTWLAQNIQQDHGPLGAAYPDVSWGMEGDTPAWLWLIPNGINFSERPDWGGWGGRYELYKPDFAELEKGDSGVPFEPETRAIWTDAIDTYTPYVASDYGRTVKRSDSSFTGDKVSLWRWRDAIQNDFAARMDWCTQSFEDANHPPVPVLGHPEQITVKSGEGFGLDASGSTDPDGDNLSFLWFHYPEPGSYEEEITVKGAENAHGAYVVAPEVEKPETAHFILQLTDKGSPPLTRYKRIIVNVVPR